MRYVSIAGWMQDMRSAFWPPKVQQTRACKFVLCSDWTKFTVRLCSRCQKGIEVELSPETRETRKRKVKCHKWLDHADHERHLSTSGILFKMTETSQDDRGKVAGQAKLSRVFGVILTKFSLATIIFVLFIYQNFLIFNLFRGSKHGFTFHFVSFTVFLSNRTRKERKICVDRFWFFQVREVPYR